MLKPLPRGVPAPPKGSLAIKSGRGRPSVAGEKYEMQTIQMVKSAGYIKELRRPIIGLVFVVGLLLGWVILGWWLWPVEWSDADPWDLRPEHQVKYVSLVAEEYWQTKDVSQATEALAGWDVEALANLLAAMQCQTCGSQESQQLAALAAALRLPASNALPSTEIAFSSSSSTSPRKVQGQPVIWGAILSVPMPVVATAIIVSLRVLKVGTEKARKKRRRTRPEELDQEWLTTTEEQLAQERQIEAQQPRVQQPQPQQVAPPAAQMQQQVAAPAAQMQQQMEQQKELQAAQMQQQMEQQQELQAVQMQQQMEQQQELQAVQMQQQMTPQAAQMQQQMEQMQQMAQAVPETPQQARKQTQGMLTPMKDWLGSVREQLKRMQEQSPELQQLMSPMLGQVDFLMGNLGQMQEEMPRLSPQQLKGKMGQMQMQMVQMLEQFKQLEGNLPANISPQAGAALAQMQQYTTQMMAQFQQQLGQMQQLRDQFDDGPIAHQQSELETALADILADAFDEEEDVDLNLAALIKSLKYVDVLDVLEKGKEIADQLKRGISLAPGLIYEIRGVEP